MDEVQGYRGRRRRVRFGVHAAYIAAALLLVASFPHASRASEQRFCSFTASLTDSSECYFVEQAKVAGRATIVGIGRDGQTSLRLHTEPGDNEVAGSAEMERNDAYLAEPGTGTPPLPLVFDEGAEQWWAHSILFPTDFAYPTWHNYVVFDFHHDAPDGQANFMVLFNRQADTTDPGILTLRGFGGPVIDGGMYEAPIGLATKNVWYDFVYHVKWSSGAGGFFDAWVRTVGETFYRRVLAHQGPTLYTDIGTYLKLANYHVPVCDPYDPGNPIVHCASPLNMDQPPSSVIHDRVVQGTTPDDVKDAAAPLEFWFEETEASVGLSGTWMQRGPEVAPFSRTFAVSADLSAASATFAFSGTSVTWRGIRCNVCGIATVSVDGGPQTPVDTAGPHAPGSSELTPETVFTASQLSPGSHTLQVTVTGTTTSGGTHILVDRFDTH